jgi:phospholipase/carboxylesterase
MKNRRPKPALRQARAAAARPPRHALPGIPDNAGVFVPQGYEPGYPYPLLVWLPATPAAAFDVGRAMARVSLRNFVAVVPADAAADDVGEAVWDAIESVRERLSIHADRIYLVGVGTGGTEAFRIACRQPEAYAGVVSLGGAFPLDEGLFARVESLRRLPMLLCCRRDDDDADSRARTDRTLRLFHAAGATLALRIYPGCADLSKPVLADVNRWLMDDVCGPPARQPAACGREP